MAENKTTELVFILDRSGSMGGLESDTIGGFNSMIAKQKKEESPAFVTTVLFDHEMQTLHDRIPLKDVPEMTDKDYTVRGSTALIDAIGETIRHIEDIHKYARPEDVPAHTMFVITTDGQENSSRHFSSNDVKKMISRLKEEKKWEFIFIGANIDAVETGRMFGITRDRVANYRADKKGTRKLFDTIGAMARRVRAEAAMPDNWQEDLEEDLKDRS